MTPDPSKPTCAEEGCERAIQARGLCQPHYAKGMRDGTLVKLDPGQAHRNHFWARVQKGDGCWEWHGSMGAYGYGQFSAPTGNKRAHRYAWELTNGPIPEGMVLDHLCRNRACVNPQHLEVVTNRENVLRGIGPSAVNAEKTHCVNGHEFNEANTRNTKDGRRRCRTCGANRQRAYYARQKDEEHELV